MTVRNRSVVLLGIVAVALSACGNSGTNSTPQVQAPVVAKTEDQFGSCFAARYQAAPNTKATDPVPCPDLAPVSLTTKPAAI